jgi:hypothetical protein
MNGETVETDGTFTNGSSFSIKGNVLTIISNNLDEESDYSLDDDGKPSPSGNGKVYMTYRGAGFTVYTLKFVFKK